MKIYGVTEYWENGMLECLYDGFGEEENGMIIWEEGYNPPKDDEFHFTTIIRQFVEDYSECIEED